MRGAPPQRGEYKCGRCGQWKRGHTCLWPAARKAPPTAARSARAAHSIADAGLVAARAQPRAALCARAPEVCALPPTLGHFFAPRPTSRADEVLAAHWAHLGLVSTSLGAELERHGAAQSGAPLALPPDFNVEALDARQVDDARWLLALFERGRSGVLCAERGATRLVGCVRGASMAQTIACIAALRERGTRGPVLVCAPLSTLGEWAAAFSRFAPSVSVVCSCALPHAGGVETASPPRAAAEAGLGSGCDAVMLLAHSGACDEARTLRSVPWALSVVDAAGHAEWAHVVGLVRRVRRLHLGRAHGYNGTCTFVLAHRPPPLSLPVLCSLRRLLLLPLGDDDFDMLVVRAGRDARLADGLRAMLGPFIRDSRARVERVRLEPISHLDARYVATPR
ncbi:hypothetical protein KFE25_002654 [Diacronema lutheri]|uniref:SNF2 N-terminal domain-containing protein n=1 Tax=Diacronema lutheri TaxID=2081491 RepID=A0A8J5XNR2_DIALT|nr:hypothetical protein KFE25_002654 [Diacronema lutheri]